MNKVKLIALSTLIALSSGVNAKTYKFAANIQDFGAIGQLITKFTEEVREKTDKRVNIKIFWNGTLGGQAQYLQQVKRGVIDFGLASSAVMESIDSDIGVINLPYIFRSTDEYKMIMDSDYAFNEIFSKTKPHNIETLGYMSNGFRSILSKDKVETIADIKGKKFRVPPSKTFIDTINNLGATAVPLDFSETYPAIQQGLVDGAEGTLASMYDSKLGEVAKFGLRTEQARLTDFVIASTKSMSKMSEADAKVVRDTMKQISTYSVEFVDGQQAGLEEQAVSEMGVSIVSVNKLEFMKSLNPMFDAAKKDGERAQLVEHIFSLQGRSKYAEYPIVK